MEWTYKPKQTGRQAMATKTDPVCKMDVDAQTAEAKSQHKGQTYYFCCPKCKDKFDKNPDHYVSGKKTANK
jgi:Cu+-exporting ATPase